MKTKIYKGSDSMEIPQGDLSHWSKQGWSAPDSNNYIGATNWSNLQKQYNSDQLNYATKKYGNDIYWNPDVNIADYGKTTTSTLQAGLSSDISSSLPDSTGANKAMEFLGQQAIEASTQAERQLAEMQKAQMEQTKNQQAQQQTTIDTERANQDQTMGEYDQLSKPFYEDTFNKYNQQFGTEQMIMDYKALAYDLANYGKEMVGALEIESSRPSLLSVSQGRQSNITSTYTSKIATSQAAMAALSNSVNMVYTHINNAANAITLDREQRISFLNLTMSLSEKREGIAQTAMINLQEDEKKQINTLVGQMQKEVERVQANKDIISELMVDPQMAPIIHNSGVMLTDTQEEMAKKINKYLVNNPQITYGLNEPLTVNEAKSLGVPYGTTRGEAMQKGITIPQGGGTSRSTSGGTSEGGETAGSFFTKTQLSKGATKAGVSLEEFASYPVDIANTFINGSEQDIVILYSQMYFDQNKGADGYVSPDDYSFVKQAFVEDGHKADVFDQKMASYRNPNNPDYQLGEETIDYSQLKSKPTGLWNKLKGWFGF